MGRAEVQPIRSGMWMSPHRVAGNDRALFDEARHNVERENTTQRWSSTVIQKRDEDGNASGYASDWLAWVQPVKARLVSLQAWIQGYGGSPGADYFAVTLEAASSRTGTYETLATLAQVEDVSVIGELFEATSFARDLRAGDFVRIGVTQTGSPYGGSAPSATVGLQVFLWLEEQVSGGRDG